MFRTISGRARAKRILIILASALVLLYMLAPIYWVFACSFQQETALSVVPPYFFPNSEIFTLGHYKYLFTGEVQEEATVMLQTMYTLTGTKIWPAVLNSIYIASIVTFINVVIGFPAGHAFARYRFWADRNMLLVMLATRLLPSMSIVIPTFIILRAVGLVDTKIALIAFYSAMTLPFTIWIMRAYFSGIPVEFEEAAQMDGCRYLRMLTKVVIPLARPGLIAAAIFAFMYSYAEFVLATILTKTEASRTQTAIIAHVSQGHSVSHGMLTAAASLAIIPPLIIAIVFRKQIIEGLTARLGL